MGVYANYDATPVEIVEAYRDDPPDLRWRCESGAVPARSFSLQKAWRLVWVALEPEAFLATAHPLDVPSEPAGPIGAAVVGAKPLNETYASEQADRAGPLYHTRWSTPSEVRESADALSRVSPTSIAAAYGSGAVERAFSAFRGGLTARPEGAYQAVEALRAFYASASAERWAVIVIIA